MNNGVPQEQEKDPPVYTQGLWKAVGLSSETQWPLQEKSGGSARGYGRETKPNDDFKDG